MKSVNKILPLHVYVVVQFYPWFKFSFLLFLGMVMYDNNMIMSLKQKKRKFEPRIKLNHNIYLYSDVHAVVVWFFWLTHSNLTPFNIKSVLLIATEWMNCRLFVQHVSSFFMLYRVLTELWILEKFLKFAWQFSDVKKSRNYRWSLENGKKSWGFFFKATTSAL